MASGSVDCIVTSPPYWGLRNYGIAGQIGLEPTMAEYLTTMVRICRELRRVLKPSGVMFLNIGDCYARSGKGGNPGHSPHVKQKTNGGSLSVRSVKRGAEFAAKQLMMIPNRLAIALQDDGWYVRSEIVWHKPNPMTESVTDRPTNCHEKVWMLTKRAHYFFDAEAVATLPAAKTLTVRTSPRKGAGVESTGEKLNKWTEENGGRYYPSKVNIRNIWRISSRPFKGAHFATFPIELAERCIMAGSSERGCCARCGAPHVRITEKSAPDIAHQRACGGDAAGAYAGIATKNFAVAGAQDASAVKARILAGLRGRITIGWRATCKCGSHAVPALVLDCFSGAGTTALVASRLGRRSLNFEINPDYVALARARLKETK